MESGGAVPYSYGEATGYLLTWLRFRQAVSAPEDGLQPRMRSAFEWLSLRWVDTQIPFTRCYRNGHQFEDWRNRFLFSFDLAMMLRGAYAASPNVGTALAGPVVCGLIARLKSFVDRDGTLASARQVRDGPRPERWSVSPGPHQVKTAAAILEVPLGVLPGWLQRAAQRTWERWSSFEPTARLSEDELHPAFYFVEGLLMRFGSTADPRCFERAAAACDVLCSSSALAHCRRSDCIAQALRAGCLLSSYRSLDSASEARLRELAARLATFQGPEGAVYFDRSMDGRLRHANAWCSMFAAQAWWALRHRRDASADGALPRFLV